MGWELFKNYLIAKEKFQPDFWLYENNKSAAKAIKDQIKKEFGIVEGQKDLTSSASDARYNEINSALVSAQNRQRFYCHNCGDVGQPEDRGILLCDVLERGIPWREKGYCLAEPVAVGHRNRREEDGKLYRRYETSGSTKANALTTVQTDSMVAEPIRIGTIEADTIAENDSQSYRVYSPDGKSVTLCGNGGCVGGKTGIYAVPLEDKAYCLTATYGNAVIDNTLERNQRSMVAAPVNIVDGKSQTIKAQYYKNSVANICCYTSTYGATGVAIATDDVPNDFIGDGKDPYSMKRVYEVKGGMVTIKGKQYPIKLADGWYYFRKLTPVECERLQTLPDGYTAGISDTQRYKCLGNGWTAEVIIHILMGALRDVPRDEKIVVLSMYDGIATGRYCLDKMGFTNVEYHAYEIDKYAMKVALKNYHDIIEHGDAFQLREDGWEI